jgi:7,8-didemethyl-8-hydroxy-5-deazariboflavin synthase CofH subunit
LRQEQCGDIVSYVINRNINYTNVCEFTCHFCAFSKGKFGEEATRDKPYCLDSEEIARRTKEAWDKGATEVCMQGGIHPDFTGESYLDFLKAAKTGAPNMHVHAFSPLEIHHGATSLNVPIKDYLKMLKDAGLGSLPGTAAEVLDDAVRQEICPDKLNSEEWLSVVKSAHQVGIKTTSTIMFGHVDSETHVSWSEHLLALRELHRETNGITEFVPLPFVHFKAPIYEKGRARKGPTMRECVLMHAIGRLVLGPIGIKNIQASWPKMGPSFASNLLFAGCNDVGGVLMNESITRAAGSTFGQEFNVVEMEALITRAGRVPRLRNTLYENANEERRMVGIENAHKSVVVNFAGGGKQQVEE